jgi:uncharacterized membrane protein YGL010W
LTVRTIDQLFADYSEHHRTTGNKWCHRIGIPLIMVSLLGMLARVTFWRLDAAVLLIAAAAIFYLRLDLRLGLMMTLIAIIFYYAGAWLLLWVNVALFVFGWILQFVGHSVYEKRQPAFLTNLVHLLVGPVWLLDSLISAGRPRAARVS